ncbi:hypothetical protein TNCV_2552381 [Trichonephila clavipes]|nr:hypothetical protein TNCV_2552381 [Trichonephila clavipes]
MASKNQMASLVEVKKAELARKIQNINFFDGLENSLSTFTWTTFREVAELSAAKWNNSTKEYKRSLTPVKQ